MQKNGKSGKRLKKRRLIPVLAALLVIFSLWTVWQNLNVKATYYELYFEDLPESFDGFAIAQISDLHNAVFGRENKQIIDILKEAGPDMIAITGDFVDSRRTDTAVSVALAGEMIKIAPCFYVTGNHESRIGEAYEKMEKELSDAGVNVLRCEQANIARDGESILIMGVDDPFFFDRKREHRDSVMHSELNMLEYEEGFRILLSHRPEMFPDYAAHGIDLTLSGHAHGGQFRLPWIGGLVAPHQGLFAKYDGGVYREDNSVMVNSRGIGNSVIPVRINNQPEVVIVTLYRRVKSK